jgi:hypothetical protein
MPGEDIPDGCTEFMSEKLSERIDGFSRQFNIGSLVGRISDAQILRNGTEVGYIVDIDGETPRLIIVDPKPQDGLTGEEQAVRQAIKLRNALILNKGLIRG